MAPAHCAHLKAPQTNARKRVQLSHQPQQFKMQINDEILHDFIYCQYKAYLKSKDQTGIFSEYQTLYNQLRQSQKICFEKTLSDNPKSISPNSTFNASNSQKGISLNIKFKNENIDLTVDAINFTGKKNIIPIFITPFEKVTKADKLFIALQASFIQSEYNLYSESCKIIYGKNLNQTKFGLSLFTKNTKKIINELNKILSTSSAPAFFKNGHCQICEFQKSCLDKLIERDDLSLLAGLKPQEIISKNNRGVFSVKQLSYTFRPKRNPYRKRKFLPELKALAIREGKTFIQESPNIATSPNEVFLDIEGVPDRNFYYLIGVIVKTNDSETNYSFWANNENDEGKIFIELFTLLQSLSEFTIYHYGSYEIHALKKISKLLTSERQEFLKKIVDNSFNLLNIFTHNLYPPTYSNGLKEIAGFLKFDWSEINASGLQSVVWRYNWEMTQSNELKHKLIKYNIEDCRALSVVKGWVKTIVENENENQFTSSVKSENIFKWGVTNYIVKEFEEINSRAYFDYQREHIFLRTEKKVYRAVKKQSQNSKAYNKPDTRINLFPGKCPYCRSKDIIKIKLAKKLQVDIAFMKQGIKKRATLFTGGPSICGKCKRKIPSTDMKRVPMYGHNLMIWCVNQKIQYKQSSDHINNFLKDSFRINVSLTQMTRFKELIAKKYLCAHEEIIKEITKSELIHVDETIARIKGVDGYVWVFANYDSVYYEFRETRETDFLKELMKDFNGVLVSDFYTGYDFLECKQQKCMVHLIRDLNEDFLKHQFDIELKTVVIEFGNLLRSIITTIDKFGLKQIHLNKHKKEVERFYSNVISQKFESEFALSYQKRFTKYKEKLFRFLECDNIPWNNNNAEHAIKPFAKWRKKISRSLTRQNIEHHLVLLSILQTCKYRGINFFDFLKSGEMSISRFSERTK